MKRLTKAAMAVAAVTSLAGCASMMYTPPTAEEAMQVIRAGFAERGVAKLDRIQQTELQAACSKYPKGDLPKELRVRLEKSAEAAIRYPADGKWLGDWRQGERIAQSGVGLTFIGPTLYHYGKLRGNSEAIMRYTWARIWNSHAFNACSSMPRYGDAGILTEEQIRHVMALLLDPQSPANR